MDNRKFLDGIDEAFERLMKHHSSNGKSNGKSRPVPSQGSATARIVEQIAELTHTQREEVLAFIQSLKQNTGE